MDDRDVGIISGVIAREGGAKVTDDPLDRGGRTQFGISEASNPEAWKDGKVTEQEARDIYEAKYLILPGFNKIHDSRLMGQVVDFAVLSGPQLATMTLQSILGIPRDGVFGPVAALKTNQADPVQLNNRLMVERVKMIGRILARDPSQLKYASGWLDRILSFLL